MLKNANRTFYFPTWTAFADARFEKKNFYFLIGDTVIIKNNPNVIYVYAGDNHWKAIPIEEYDEEQWKVHSKTVRDTFNKLTEDQKRAVNFLVGCAIDEEERKMLMRVEEVIFNYPATIVYWADGTKTVVKCSSEDKWDEEIGFALAYVKKSLGNKSNYNTYIRKILKDAKRYNNPELSSYGVTFPDAAEAAAKAVQDFVKRIRGSKKEDSHE